MIKKILVGLVIVFIGNFSIFCQDTWCQTIPVIDLTKEINIEINESPIQYTDIYVQKTNGFKSYMNYKALTKTDSPQYLLQELCATDADGFRRCADRYVIAVGHGVGGQVGDCVDLILQNGQIIYCVIGDYKSKQFTDSANLTGYNGCCSEFIVETEKLRRDIKYRGNVGIGYIGWESPVLLIRRYNINYLQFNLLGGSKDA